MDDETENTAVPKPVTPEVKEVEKAVDPLLAEIRGLREDLRNHLKPVEKTIEPPEEETTRPVKVVELDVSPVKEEAKKEYKRRRF